MFLQIKRQAQIIGQPKFLHCPPLVRAHRFFAAHEVAGQFADRKATGGQPHHFELAQREVVFAQGRCATAYLVGLEIMEGVWTALHAAQEGG